MLTVKQKQLLEYIADYTAKSGGVSPSYDEMKERLGLASKSGVFRLVEALETKGMIRRHAYMARAIQVCFLPDGTEAANLQRINLGSNRNAARLAKALVKGGLCDKSEREVMKFIIGAMA